MAQPKTTPPSSPWGAAALPNTVKSFRDMMDEEYAKQLEEKDIREEEEVYLKQIEQLNLNESQNQLPATDLEVPLPDANVVAVSPADDTTDNDLMLARLLQMEFDRENDEHIRSLEKNMNGSQKVSMNFKNYYSHKGMFF